MQGYASVLRNCSGDLKIVDRLSCSLELSTAPCRVSVSVAGFIYLLHVKTFSYERVCKHLWLNLFAHMRNRQCNLKVCVGVQGGHHLQASALLHLLQHSYSSH